MTYSCIVTIGPASASKDTIQAMAASGADCFRVNLSHADENSFHTYLNLIKSANINPSIDTQGAQGRITSVEGGDQFLTGESVHFDFSGNFNSNFDHSLTINHKEIINQIAPGDLLRVDFTGLLIEITEIDKISSTFTGKVESEGKCTKNRAFDIQNKPIELHPLTEFDKWCLLNSQDKGIDAVFHSFASCALDVEQTRRLSPKGCKIIAKIESKKGLANINEIIESSDGVLIDRGDLSREISISMVPSAVTIAIEQCKQLNKDVYIATNILDSMMVESLPSRAEISDIHNLLEIGANGLVLAAEAAIGKQPIQSVQVINHMQKIVKMKKLGLLGILKNEDIRSQMNSTLEHWL